MAGKDLVIYDNARAGKTVCSYRVRQLLTDPNRRAQFFGRASDPPLVVRLDGYWRRTKNTKGELLTLREMLVEQFIDECELDKPVERKVAEATIRYALRERRVVIILDGFDQFLPEDREHVAEIYKHPAESHLCRWIVTSRVHAIEDWRDRDLLFHDAKWTRVRIDPFSEEKQSQYFEKPTPGYAAIGDRWTQAVDPQSMGELLGLPMVLWLLRVLIEAADEEKEPIPRFSGLSQLYLIASRWLLRRALRVNKDAVEKKLAKEGIPPHTGLMGERIDDLEHVLTLTAFQMMLIGEYNGRRNGEKEVAEFEQLCLRRYLWDEYVREVDLLSPDFVSTQPKKWMRWKWAVEVLRTIEFEHRTVTESFGRDFIAFRSRKMLECHAARYWTKYANEWDIFADHQTEEQLISVSPTDSLDLGQRKDLVRICAWNYTTHDEWTATWQLAIGMPHAVLDNPRSQANFGRSRHRPRGYVPVSVGSISLAQTLPQARHPANAIDLRSLALVRIRRASSSRTVRRQRLY